jgi:hypothetical protein
MPFVADYLVCRLQVRARIGRTMRKVLRVALPLGALPLGALPLGALPLGAMPFGGMPLGALPLGAQFLGAMPLGVRSVGVGAIVQAMCLTAFESEMSQAGKVAPEGMAGFACRCVADRIMQGRGVEESRKECRLATRQRFPI